MGLIAAAQNDIAVFPRGAAGGATAPPPTGFNGNFSGAGPGGKFTGNFKGTPTPSSGGASAVDAAGFGGGNVNVYGLSPAVPIPATYPFGQFSAQIDFTVIENVNGGPAWTTRYFKGPGGNASGLINLNRQVKDTLVVTFVPVCIREKYYPIKVGTHSEYTPEMVDGTPGWANYLPTCSTPGHQNLQANAIAAAKFENNTLSIQSRP